MPIRIGCADIVLHVFCLTCHRIIHVTVQNLVKLENIILCDRNRVKTIVYDVQHIPVSRNLLLVPVSRRCLFLDKLSDTGICCNDSFNGIGRFRALYFCDLHQFFKIIRALLQIQLLFPGFFINSGNQREHFRIPFLISYFSVIKISHACIPQSLFP